MQKKYRLNSWEKTLKIFSKHVVKKGKKSNICLSISHVFLKNMRMEKKGIEDMIVLWFLRNCWREKTKKKWASFLSSSSLLRKTKESGSWSLSYLNFRMSRIRDTGLFQQKNLWKSLFYQNNYTLISETQNVGVPSQKYWTSKLTLEFYTI